MCVMTTLESFLSVRKLHNVMKCWQKIMAIEKCELLCEKFFRIVQTVRIIHGEVVDQYLFTGYLTTFWTFYTYQVLYFGYSFPSPFPDWLSGSQSSHLCFALLWKAETLNVQFELFYLRNLHSLWVFLFKPASLLRKQSFVRVVHALYISHSFDWKRTQKILGSVR